MDEKIHRTAHIPKWKTDEIEDIKAKVEQHSVVGMLGIHGMPSKQFQQMRSNLTGSALIKVSKNNLISLALAEISDEIKTMDKYITKETGLVFSNENSFKLFKLIQSSKTPAPIKGGMEAPENISVEKGPTAFPPGPIVGELQAAGIPAAIEGGKVVIRDTSIVAKKGEVVSQNLASMLTRLDIFPLELGLELRATFEDNIIFDASTLAIDETLFFKNFTTASSQAFNLAVNVAYPTKATIQTILAMAVSDSKNLAVNAAIFTPGVIDILLSKAQNQMLALSGIISDEALDEDLKAALGSQVAVSIPQVEVEEEQQDEKKEDEPVEESKEESEEEAAEGLGTLFG